MVTLIVSRLLLLLSIAGVLGWKFAGIVAGGAPVRFILLDVCLLLGLALMMITIGVATVRQHCDAVSRTHKHIEELELRLDALRRGEDENTAVMRLHYDEAGSDVGHNAGQQHKFA